MPQIDFTIFFIFALWIFPIFFGVFFYSLVHVYPVFVLWNNVVLYLYTIAFLKIFYFFEFRQLPRYSYLFSLA